MNALLIAWNGLGGAVVLTAAARWALLAYRARSDKRSTDTKTSVEAGSFVIDAATKLAAASPEQLENLINRVESLQTETFALQDRVRAVNEALTQALYDKATLAFQVRSLQSRCDLLQADLLQAQRELNRPGGPEGL